jgi:hypothetical protein
MVAMIRHLFRGLSARWAWCAVHRQALYRQLRRIR